MTNESVEQSGEFSMAAVEQDLLNNQSNMSLHSIPEIPEQEAAAAHKKAAAPEDKSKGRPRRRSRSATPSPRSRSSFSIGALLGTLLRYIVAFFTAWLIIMLRFVAAVGFFTGRFVGWLYHIVVSRPLQLLTGARGSRPLGKYILLGLTILSAWYALQSPSFSSHLPTMPLPGSSHSPVYTPPSKPVENIDELVQRLARIESALSDLSLDNTKLKLKTEDSIRSYGDVLQRVGSVEGRITAEARRISETESRAREMLGRNVNSVKQEIEALQAQLEAAQKQAERDRQQRQARDKELEQHRPAGDTSDEEARARLRALEERVGSVEGGVKEALEIGKKLASAPPPVVTAAPSSPSGGAAWWNKIISRTGTKDGLKITTPDGHDVTGLISSLVDSAVSVVSKDGVAKPDFALHSAGGRVIPSLTSPTFEIKPSTLRAAVFGALTGNGYASGHPPVTAIEPSLHAGRCWPMAGTGGQLAVALAMPVYVDEITIDHVATEVAFDMRTAPRQMEVWGLVEGEDNIRKLHAHREFQIARKRQEFEDRGEMLDEDWEKREWENFREGYPATLPKSPEYLRIAKFTYDIHAPKHVQTFQADEEVRDLELDFGVVVARVLNNWGHDTYTCLYRFRVHGQKMAELPPPYSEEQVEESS